MAVLNDRQVRWVEQMLVTGNATEAARRAGYRSPKKQGERMSANVAAQKLLEAGRQQQAAKAEIDAEFVLQGLKREALGQGPDTNASARVASYSQISKILGLIEQRMKVELSAHPDFGELITKITAALKDHPAAAAAVAQALGEDEA